MEAKKGTEMIVRFSNKATKEAGSTSGFGSLRSPFEQVLSPTTLLPSGRDNGGYLPKRARFSTLNPNARKWDPRVNRAREEDRCLFFTFSNGYPLTEEQITRFFTMKYGQCVERVYVHKPGPRYANKSPLFGKVLFNRCSIPSCILSEDGQSKFMVDGKPLWCKRYDPTRRPNQAHRYWQVLT